MRLLTKILITLLLIVGFFYYTPDQIDSYSASQRRYEKWLTQTLRSKTLATSNITLTLTNQLNNHSVQLKFAADHAAKLSRILKLIPETGLLAKQDSLSNQGTFTLSIKSNHESFDLTFSETNLAQNVKLQNLVTLFQMYSLGNPPLKENT